MSRELIIKVGKLEAMVERLASGMMHNGKVLEDLIEVSGMEDKLREKRDTDLKKQHEEYYEQQLTSCVEMADKGEARRCSAGVGATVFARNVVSNAPLAVQFDDLPEDKQKLLEGKIVGDEVPIEAGTLVITGVFDLRRAGPTAVHPARRKR